MITNLFSIKVMLTAPLILLVALREINTEVFSVNNTAISS